jgi:hypothetical protein
MSGNAYKALGFVVWHVARWYLRRRLPAARRVAAAGVLVVAGIAGAVALARRNGG